MNVTILTGRLTKDAELSFLPGTGTPKISFDLAVEREYQKKDTDKKVDFIRCEMLGKHTENLAQYVTKGKLISVVGELNIDQYEKNGERKSFTKINTKRLEFLSGASTENKKDFSNDLQEISTDDIPF